ncbi:hypothetical protein [Laspinema palackyanum]|uniref:hypothetical protein n=1 Tax=Laspinema palackyanum TaxID=3231601 RepID=UPI00345C7398|nr:hypothetical protein [Laspinema sp. D2c]
MPDGLFVFPSKIQAAIASGAYEVVKNSAGTALGIAQDKATGQFVAHAIGMSAQPFLALTPLQIGLTGMQMAQNHLDFLKISRMLNDVLNTVAALQASTPLIGLDPVAGVVLAAVNIWQALKWREDIKKLHLQVNNGFIDLKHALKNQRAEILQRIEQIPKDIQFKNHEMILSQSYEEFKEAIVCLNHALIMTDMKHKNDNFTLAKGMLHNALVTYNNPNLYQQTSAAGQLRRMECSWLIDQTITTIYQLQGQHEVVSARLSNLRKKIRDNSLQIIDRCECDNELDFLFPEVMRIHTQDLPLLESWQNQVDWMKSLSPSELKELASLELPDEENSGATANTNPAEPPVELSFYETLKQKSHYDSLRDQLRFIVKPELRQHHESYVFQRANATGYPALAPSNWQEVPDLTVANLYHYFKQQERYA